VVFNLGGTTLAAGNYTLEIYQTNMSGGGAYAIYDGVLLDDASVLPAELRILSAGFNGAAFEVETTGLDTSKSYVMKRSDDLQDGFPTTVDGPRVPTDVTDTFTDPDPLSQGAKAFYRIEEAP